MKTFTIAAVALGVVLVQGAPMAQAQDCEGRVAELERQVRELRARLEQIAGLAGGSGNAETRRTTTGAVFTRDNWPHFGESWRDPSGMIWGDIAKNADGSPSHMKYQRATEYCQSLGAQLPTVADFVRLREYMGARSGSNEGYTPQVLPNLTPPDVPGETFTNYFWSSMVHPEYTHYAFDFYGRSGDISYYNRYFPGNVAVRCVARR